MSRWQAAFIVQPIQSFCWVGKPPGPLKKHACTSAPVLPAGQEGVPGTTHGHAAYVDTDVSHSGLTLGQRKLTAKVPSAFEGLRRGVPGVCRGQCACATRPSFQLCSPSVCACWPRFLQAKRPAPPQHSPQQPEFSMTVQRCRSIATKTACF